MKAPVLPLNSFELSHQDKKIIPGLFEGQYKKIKILIYGKPGTGKTELARSLAINIVGKAFELNSLNENDKNVNSRLRGLIVFGNSPDSNNSVMIIDEADSVLNQPGFMFFSRTENSNIHSEKGRLNTVLDETNFHQIWISNSISNVHESTLSRFDFSLNIDKLSVQQRKNIWQGQLKKLEVPGLISPETIDKLSERYDISARQIEKALTNSLQMSNSVNSPGELIEIIDSTINKSDKILFGNYKNSLESDQEHETYSIEALNLSCDKTSLLSALDGFNQEWEIKRNNIKGCTMLFWGSPGTGKTEFAKYLARRLKRRLLVKRASDMLSCWVGETEKNIRKSFEEAEKTESILFLDEIDSFLQNRKDASRSWEITQVNELLSALEHFHGLLIAATNLKLKLDTASVRRFNFKIEFNYLNGNSIPEFYSTFFKNWMNSPLTEDETAKLKTLSFMTPGDFKVVREQFRFVNKEQQSFESLYIALLKESQSKNIKKKIGFVNE